MERVCAAVVIVLLPVVAGVGVAQDAPLFGGSDVRSMFHISKSENRNQVHYGLHLTEGCLPRGPSPVFAYWRDLEVGPDQTSPLLDYEQAAYGISPGQRVSRVGGRSTVHFVLRAFPDRELVAAPRGRKGRCTAVVHTRITKVPAVLARIHLELGFLWSISSLTIEGRALDDGTPVREVIDE